MSLRKDQFALTVLVIAMTSCNAQNERLYDGKINFMDSRNTSMTALTITKVKKPWYAWKGLVISKMKKSIPEYAVAPGLVFKYYSFAEEFRYFGGIYVWRTGQDAANWFNQSWFDRTRKKYGETGIVMRFSIQKIISMANPPASEGDYLAVLSEGTMTTESLGNRTGGLLQVIELIDGHNKPFHLSLWENRAAGLAFQKTLATQSEAFEVPILLSVGK